MEILVFISISQTSVSYSSHSAPKVGSELQREIWTKGKMHPCTGDGEEKKNTERQRLYCQFTCASNTPDSLLLS